MLFFWSAASLESCASPPKADERGGGGGADEEGDSDTFFRLKIVCSIFQTQSWGTHPTSQTFLTNKEEKRKEKKGGPQLQITCKKDPHFK